MPMPPGGELYPPKAIFDLLAGNGAAVGSGMPEEQGETLVRAFLSDRDGSRHVRQMDQAGVELSVLVAMDFGDGYGAAPLDRVDVMAHHRDLMERHPGRFLAFYGVNPLAPGAFSRFRRRVDEYGFRGMKFHPPLGFAADHPRLAEFYAFCEAAALPVMIHTGPFLHGLDWDHASPRRIRAVIQAHPGTNFILAHAGWQLEPEFVDMAVGLDNVYLDLAGLQLAWARSPSIARRGS